MPTSRWLPVAVFLLSGLLGAGVRAQDTDCTTNLGSVEVQGDLNIAARCQLRGTEVRGNVKLFAGGSLIARDARILGNVEGRRADFVDIDQSVIDGNVRLEEFVGDLSTIQRSDIHGKASLKDNRSRLEIVNNDFDGGLEASRNQGGLLISGNSFGGELRCSGNDPAPTGLGNRIDGDAKGQCRNLEPYAESTPPASDEPEDEEDEPEEPEEPEEPPPVTPPRPSTPPPSSSPPRSSPPPSTSPPMSGSPPRSSPPPPTSPPLSGSPPPTTPPPAASPPPSPSPPPETTSSAAPPVATPPAPATPAPVDPLAEDDGGAGAFGWPVAFFLPLLAWRRFVRRRAAV